MQLMVSHSLLKFHHVLLGKTRDEQVDNLVTILDGYFENGGQHVNLNVMDLNDVYEKIMSGEDVIVRISGYCVNTKYLTPEQKLN